MIYLIQKYRLILSWRSVLVVISRLSTRLRSSAWLMLATHACRQGYSVRYFRSSRLLEQLTIAHGDGRFAKLINQLAKTDLLVLDDWGLETLSLSQRNDVLELMEDRHGNRSTLITSQVPIQQWHDAIGDPTLADAILDRLLHNAHRLPLKGESMRRLLAE